MVSNKLFHVEGWFNLPDKFPGGCGQALVGVCIGTLLTWVLIKFIGNQDS